MELLLDGILNYLEEVTVPSDSSDQKEQEPNVMPESLNLDDEIAILNHYCKEDAPLRILGSGRNPARPGTHIWGNKTHAFRIDKLSEAKAELTSQCNFIKKGFPALAEGILSGTTIDDMHNWKLSLASFFSDDSRESVVKIFSILNSSNSKDTVSITKMQLGDYTAEEAIQNDKVSLRQLVRIWLYCLKNVEESYGLTYVDATFENIMLFGENNWRLIDLESLQPLYLLFARESDCPEKTPAVPPTYKSLFSGCRKDLKADMQKFFVGVLKYKWSRYFVERLNEKCEYVQKNCSKDTEEDIQAVRKFISTAEKLVESFGTSHGTSPHEFYRELWKQTCSVL